MKKLAILFVSFFAISLIITSCTKDTSERHNLLIEKNWKMIECTVSPGIANGTVTITDYYNVFMSPCLRDDICFFYKNGTMKKSEGTDVCDVNNRIVYGSWVFNTDESHLLFSLSYNNASASSDYEILELSSSALKIKYTIPGTVGTTVVNYTYTAKFNVQ